MFDMVESEDLFGEDTWEAAESTMQKEACFWRWERASGAADIRYLFGGDLLRQGIATSIGVEGLGIPMFGLFGACSTAGEALALASMSVAGNYGDYMMQLLPAILEARRRNSVFRLDTRTRGRCPHSGR